MLCENCQKRPATVHLTKIINGQKSEVNLCEVCAQENQDFAFGFEPKFMFPNIFANFFQPAADFGGQSIQKKGRICEKCGFSHDHFAKIGLLGCDKCYEIFAEQLDPVLRRVHGTNRHTGKVPKRTGGEIKIKKEIEELKKALNDAVAREEYEKAAEIRDKIREIEQGNK